MDEEFEKRTLEIVNAITGALQEFQGANSGSVLEALVMSVLAVCCQTALSRNEMKDLVLERFVNGFDLIIEKEKLEKENLENGETNDF